MLEEFTVTFGSQAIAYLGNAGVLARLGELICALDDWRWWFGRIEVWHAGKSSPKDEMARAALEEFIVRLSPYFAV